MADNINLDNYADLRDISRGFCANVQAQVTGHLETVRVLFRPAALFGAHLAGIHKDNPRDAALNIGQFRTYFSEAVAPKPMSLDGTLPDPFEIDFGTPALYPFVYTHEITTRTGPKKVTVTAPLQWVLGFPNHPVSRMRELMAAPKRDTDELRKEAMHFATLSFVVAKNPKILELFAALRFPIQIERLPEFGNLPLLLMRAPAGSVRPPDDVIAQVCKYSGIDAVEEILDREAWASMKDPIGEQFAEINASMQV